MSAFADTILAGGRPVGQMLVDAGLITHQQLADALTSQSRTGGRLGMHLMLSGAVTRLELYQCIADQLGFPFANLVDDPPDAELMAVLDPRTHIDREWIPHHWDGESLIVATTDAPSRRTVREAREEFGAENVDFIVTTDWDLDQAVTKFCRSKLLFNAAEELASNSPERSAKGKPVPWQRFFAYLVSALIVGGMVIKPAGTIVASTLR